MVLASVTIQPDDSDLGVMLIFNSTNQQFNDLPAGKGRFNKKNTIAFKNKK